MAGLTSASGTAGLTFGAVTAATSTFTANNPATYGAVTLLTLGAIMPTSNDNITFAGSGNITTGAIGAAGTAGVTMQGTGNLTLSTANGFTGGLTVNSGTVVATTSATALGAGALNLAGGTVDLSYATGQTLTSYAPSVTGNSAIIADVSTAGAGISYTFGTLGIGAQRLIIQGGANVTSGTAGVNSATSLPPPARSR